MMKKEEDEEKHYSTYVSLFYWFDIPSPTSYFSHEMHVYGEHFLVDLEVLLYQKHYLCLKKKLLNRYLI